MEGYAVILSFVKQKEFDKASSALKTWQGNAVELGNVLKLLRVIANQLKQSEEDPHNFYHVSSIVQMLAGFVANSTTVGELEEAEHLQGGLAIYYLTVAALAGKVCSEDTVPLLSNAMLNCLRHFKNCNKNIEPIVINFGRCLWGDPNKVVSEERKIFAIQGSVYSGASNWFRIIAYLGLLPVAVVPRMAQFAVEEMVTFCLTRSEIIGPCHLAVLICAWCSIACAEDRSPQHHLAQRVRDILFAHQELPCFVPLFHIILNITGSGPVGVEWSKLEFETEELNEMFIRVSLKLFFYSNSPGDLNQTQNTYKLLSLFCRRMDDLKSIIEKVKKDFLQLKVDCIVKMSMISLQLVKMKANPDLNSLTMVDELVKELRTRKADKHLKVVLPDFERCAYNLGINLFNNSKAAQASEFFYKSIYYATRNPNFQPCQVNLVPKLLALYDTRKTSGTWDKVLTDFKICFKPYLTKEALKSPFTSALIHVWVKFIKDIQTKSTPVVSRIKSMSLLELLIQQPDMKERLDNDACWYLIHEELKAFDCRKGSLAKNMENLSRQLEKHSTSAVQRALSCYYVSRIAGQDPVGKVEAAEKCVSGFQKLEAADANGNHEYQHYLALAYMQLFVARRDFLKYKTAEEMEKIGPLLKSAQPPDDAPKGEDSTAIVSSDSYCADGTAYTYLKLEQELRNEQLLVKSLELFEQLLRSGWTIERYSSSTFTCLKSLGHYFALSGNYYFSCRAWHVLSVLADSKGVSAPEEYLLAVGQLLKRRAVLEDPRALVDKCKKIIDDDKTDGLLIEQDIVIFYIGCAYLEFYEGQFENCSRILLDKVLSPRPSFVGSTGGKTKSGLMIESQAFLLLSALYVLHPDLYDMAVSQTEKQPLNGPMDSAQKAVRSSFSALTCYRNYALTNDWDHLGQECCIVQNFLDNALHLGRLSIYVGLSREAKFYLKEALLMSQKHALVLRTAQILLELSSIDLALESTVDCQSKLVLVCHSMGSAVSLSDRRETGKKVGKGYDSKCMPDTVEEPLAAGMVNRYLQLPDMNQGTSPSTRVRHLASSPLFGDHKVECSCLTCTSELVLSVRCTTFKVQAKLWSLMSHDNEAELEFNRGAQLMEWFLSKLHSPKSRKLKGRDLFQSNRTELMDLEEYWRRGQIGWLQPTVLAFMELACEHGLHIGGGAGECVRATAQVDQTIRILTEFYRGPLDCRILRVLAINDTLMFMSAAASAKKVKDQGQGPRHVPRDDDGEDDVQIIAEVVPKTPFPKSRVTRAAPPAAPAKKSGRLQETVTIEDDDPADEFAFARRFGTREKLCMSDDSDEEEKEKHCEESQQQTTSSPVLSKKKSKTPTARGASSRRLQETDAEPSNLPSSSAPRTRRTKEADTLSKRLAAMAVEEPEQSALHSSSALRTRRAKEADVLSKRLAAIAVESKPEQFALPSSSPPRTRRTKEADMLSKRLEAIAVEEPKQSPLHSSSTPRTYSRRAKEVDLFAKCLAAEEPGPASGKRTTRSAKK